MFSEITKIGDICSASSGIIIQQVNAQGVMASGVAKAIRAKYPQVFEEYSEVIGTHPSSEEAEARLGQVIFCKVTPKLYVANIVGQAFYGKDGKKYTSYDALDWGLRLVADFNRDIGNRPVHYPTLGCGLGGGEWSVVKALIEHHLCEFERTLWLNK